ncbi:signal peptidase II [Alkalibaculum sp. M08DMB]|uniref:Lipoprotein signal peptidase n=1 Tax=Alkalibaculum sporogenes TaxID=2655001 RepID=A0A6A7K662_9FIRM|nr:signal peptidase II [Alkalibaculum sporogenes]MPW24910.1 signal peptidase II [Alkalibaculum sporogenes]
MVYILIICLIVSLDLGSKKYVAQFFREKEINIKRIYKSLYFTLVYNEGAFLGLLSKKKLLLKFIISITIFFLYAVFIFEILQDNDPKLKLFLSFVLGGATGNYIDRIKNDRVTDFIFFKFKGLPVFNIADIFIFIGAILLIIKMW